MLREHCTVLLDTVPFVTFYRSPDGLVMDSLESGAVDVEGISLQPRTEHKTETEVATVPWPKEIQLWGFPFHGGAPSLLDGSGKIRN